jgi:hypothetical protein
MKPKGNSNEVTKPKFTVACFAAAFLLSPVATAIAESSLAKPMLKSYQERAAIYAHSDLALRGDPTNEERLARCLGDWDSSTHMTKGEWRRSCERSVVYDPDAFR